MARLIDHLEDALRTEGLSSVVPEDLHGRFANIDATIAWLWLGSLWVAQASSLLIYTEFQNWITALFIVPLLLLAFIVIYFIYAVTKNLQDPGVVLDNQKIGMMMIIFLSVGSALFSAVYFWSLWLPIYQMGISIILLAVLVIIFSQRFRIYLFLEFIKAVFIITIRSLSVISALFSVLLVIALLGVFSDDLWKVIGALSGERLVLSIALIVLPAIVLIVSSRKLMANRVLSSPINKSAILERAASHPKIAESLRKGLISEEEWDWVTEELAWREPTLLNEAFFPLIQKRVRTWLALLLAISSFLVVVVFFAYFCLFFKIVLSPQTIAEWTGLALESIPTQLELAGRTWSFEYLSTDFAIARMALILGFFFSLASAVQLLTEESSIERVTSWLAAKAQTWLSLAGLYHCAISAGYQVQRFTRRDKKTGMANVNIVVPVGTTDSEAEIACERMEARLHEYKNFVMITAFEMNVEAPIYENWIDGRRWQLIRNKMTDVRSFDPLHFESSEVSGQVFLGRNSLKNGVEIPDEWFGDSEDAVAIARDIWDEDFAKEWVLHPHASVSERASFIEIRFKKRNESSAFYLQYCKAVMHNILDKIPSAKNLTVNISFRDTSQTLANAWWERSSALIIYTDETRSKSQYFESKDWDLPVEQPEVQ